MEWLGNGSNRWIEAKIISRNSKQICLSFDGPRNKKLNLIVDTHNTSIKLRKLTTNENKEKNGKKQQKNEIFSFNSKLVEEKDEKKESKNENNDTRNEKSNSEIDHLTCEICFNEVDLDNIFIFQECYDYYCLDCLKRTLEVRIESKRKLNNILCPFDNCSKEIEFHDIRFILYHTNCKKLFDKYDKYLLDIAVQTDKNIKLALLFWFFFLLFFFWFFILFYDCFFDYPCTKHLLLFVFVYFLVLFLCLEYVQHQIVVIQCLVQKKMVQ